MGMQCRLIQVTPKNLDALLRNPRLVEPLVRLNIACSVPPELEELPGDAVAAFKEQMVELKKESLDDLQKIGQKNLAKDEMVALPEIASEWEQSSVSIEKEWHAIHYLLTGSADETGHPLSQVIMGGTEIGKNLLTLSEPSPLTPCV